MKNLVAGAKLRKSIVADISYDLSADMETFREEPDGFVRWVGSKNTVLRSKDFIILRRNFLLYLYQFVPDFIHPALDF